MVRAHYISGTHWDREWYRPFQEYRYLLVRLLDDLIELMETSEDFRYFQLDGQTCMVEDYLEIRPEMRDRLGALLSSGRILIGPWFTMPDLFCPDDESFVRNLLLGRRICRQWGVEPMPVGFICDMFGHPAQMPQIFAGFGLRDVVLGRGTNESTTPMYFSWEAPDGTRAFTFKLQDAQGYGAFALPRASLEESTFVVQNYMKEMVAELDQAADDAERTAIRERWFRTTLAKYVNHELSRANGDVICLMDSMDHTLPATDVARYLRLVHEACPGIEAEHSTLPAFFAEARDMARDVPVKQGELREPSQTPSRAYLYLIPNCVSARAGIKRANSAAQGLLERWVEPLVAIANLEGAGIHRRFLEVAWQHVLTNHAHDSICGCSIDQVHRDMLFRFDQAMELGEQLRHQAFAALTRGCRDLARTGDEFTLTLANPLPHARREVVTFHVDLPLDYPTHFHEGFNTQELMAFRLETPDGREVPYQRLAFVPKTCERSHVARYSFLNDGEYTRYTVAAEVELPALGFTSLRVVPAPQPVRRAGSLRTGPAEAANEHLAIAIAPNGTLTLTDLATGEVYRDLLTAETRSEIGDGWFHGHSQNDQILLTTASPVQAAVVHDGPEQVTFRVTATLTVPARYDWHAERPGRETVELPITHLVSLRRGARQIEVETRLDNTAEDHRLRILFPTDCTGADTYLAQTPFDLTERAIALDAGTTDWQEMELAEKPFMGVQAVGAGRRGLAFIGGGGLHEGGVADDHRRTMQVTLLRSFRRTIGTGGGTDGLERGDHAWHFALRPFAGNLPVQEVLRSWQSLHAGLLTRQTGKRPSGYPPMAGAAEPAASFLRAVDGKLVVSAIKPPESGEGLVVRLWNPTGGELTETLELWREPLNVALVNLAETEELAELAAVGNRFRVSAAPHQVVTVKISL